MATNNAWNSSVPVEIAKGGTNATSMATSTGIVKYDGTSLVTSSTALIDSSNRSTNTSQPAFLAYLGTQDDNVTGDGTSFNIGTGNALTEVFDQGSNFNTNGTFTAPVTGKYFLQFSTLVLGGTLINGAVIEITTSNRTYRTSQSTPSTSGTFAATMSVLADMDASDTVTYLISTTDTGGKIDDVFGSGPPLYTFVSGYLVC